MKKYRIYGVVTGTKYLGTIEANNESEAEDIVRKELVEKMYVSICHQCSNQIDDPEIQELVIEEV